VVGGASTGAAAAVGEPLAEEPLPALTVSAERLGPRLWRVHGGLPGTAPDSGGELWILGTISPLPIDVRWRAAEVDRLLARVDLVLMAKPLEIGAARALWLLVAHRDDLMLPHGAKLENILPRDLYARFAAMRARYADSWSKWERYQPIIAAALLEDAALEKNGLSSHLDVSLAVRHLARNHHVRIEEVATPGIPDLLELMRSAGPETQQRCMAAVLDVLEDDVQSLTSRARAWGSGDVDEIQALPAPPEVICAASLGAQSPAVAELSRTELSWKMALEARLRSRGVTLAVLDVDLLVGSEGLVAQLRRDGYTVDAP
jgi:uncharacterized protein YbaP (TraB family)